MAETASFYDSFNILVGVLQSYDTGSDGTRAVINRNTVTAYDASTHLDDEEYGDVLCWDREFSGGGSVHFDVRDGVSARAADDVGWICKSGV